MTTLILIAALAAVVIAPLADVNKPRRLQGIDELLFFPSKFPHGNWAPQDLHFEDVYFFAVDKTHLHGWFCPVENPVATILVAHGNAGNLTSRAKMLRFLQSQVGASVLIFDYRGFAKFHGPVLASHGDRDKVIPLALGERLFRAANEPKEMVTIAKADHDNCLVDDYLRRFEAFIKRVSNGKETGMLQAQ